MDPQGQVYLILIPAYSGSSSVPFTHQTMMNASNAYLEVITIEFCISISCDVTTFGAFSQLKIDTGFFTVYHLWWACCLHVQYNSIPDIWYYEHMNVVLVEGSKGTLVELSPGSLTHNWVVWLFDWLTDRPTDKLADRSIEWPIDWLTE